MTLLSRLATPMTATTAAAVLAYDSTEAVSAGANRLYMGYQVQANADIPAGTAFAWGGYGSATETWFPVQFGSAFKGAWAVGTTYAVDDEVASDSVSTAMYSSKVAGNIGNAVTDATKWSAASFTVAPSSSIPILAYQANEAYYVGQHICYNGLIVTPNASIPAGTPFAWGTTGATFKLDLDSASAYFAVNTEYVSPEQYGNIYGKVYRTYFGATLPSYLTTGSTVSRVVDHSITASLNSSRYVIRGWGSDGVGNSATILLSGAAGKGNLSISSQGFSRIDGWVDYCR